MTKKPVLLVLAALAIPATANAQSLPDGVTAKGYVEYEHLTSDGDDASGIIGDFDVSIAPFMGGVGLDFGLIGLDFEGTSESALFGALTYHVGNHKFSVGVPRSVLKDHTRMPDVGGVRYFGFETGLITDGIVDIAYLTSDEAPLGVRYDGDFGMVKVGASYHHFSDGADADVFGLGATYTRDIWFASASVEHFDADGHNGTLFHTEIGAKTDLYEAGIGLSNGDDGYFDDTSIMAWGSYYVMPQLALNASVLDVGSTTIYGVGADYTFWNGAYAQLGYLDSDDAFDGIWDVSLGWKF